MNYHTHPELGHPLTDPGDGRAECPVCHKWVWRVTHSCSGIDVRPTTPPEARASFSEVQALAGVIGESRLLPAEREAEIHRAALEDTGDAYSAFYGWVLSCLWCAFEAHGNTRRDALVVMEAHYAGFKGLDRADIRG